MPLRGSRVLVEIPEITRVFEEGESEQPIVAKMKRGIAKWFGLEPLYLNNERLIATFDDNTTDEPDQTNAGKTFFRRIGGFRQGSYTIKALGTIAIEEQFFDPNGDFTTEDKEVKSFTFGMPGGVGVTEIIEFLRVNVPSGDRDKLDRLITPRGVGYALNIDWGETVDDDGEQGDGTVT